MKPSSEVRRDILREYSRNPMGWRVFTSRDIRGHMNIIFTHEADVWFLKEERINPFEAVGFGVKESTHGSSCPPGSSFGFRPVTAETMDRIWRTIEQEENIGQIISGILDLEPLPINSIRSQGVLEGPVVSSPKPLQIFPEQKELDLKLQSELDRLIHRKYPHLITTYR